MLQARSPDICPGISKTFLWTSYIMSLVTLLLLLLLLHRSHVIASVLLNRDKLVIRLARPADLQRAGSFLASWMYPEDTPRGQRAELARLEASDLSKRYGERLRPRYPSALVLAEEEEDIIGCVGVDVQVISLQWLFP